MKRTTSTNQGFEVEEDDYCHWCGNLEHLCAEAEADFPLSPPFLLYKARERNQKTKIHKKKKSKIVEMRSRGEGGGCGVSLTLTPRVSYRMISRGTKRR